MQTSFEKLLQSMGFAYLHLPNSFVSYCPHPLHKLVFLGSGLSYVAAVLQAYTSISILSIRRIKT